MSMLLIHVPVHVLSCSAQVCVRVRVRVCGGVHVRVRVRFHLRVCVRVHLRVHVYKCWNAGLSGIRSVRYQTEKTNDAGNSPVPDLAKAVRHFLVRYRTEIIDAGMPMLALVSSMPMPSYAEYICF
jgi:hypothetical protein